MMILSLDTSHTPAHTPLKNLDKYKYLKQYVALKQSRVSQVT